VRVLTVLVEVHWARKVQATMPQIKESHLQEDHIIEISNKEGRAVSTQNNAARYERKNGIAEHVYRLLGAIAAPIRGGKSIIFKLN
jgi:hypothetical protein